jgi:hypothetical protein
MYTITASKNLNLNFRLVSLEVESTHAFVSRNSKIFHRTGITYCCSKNVNFMFFLRFSGFHQERLEK